MPSRGPWAQIGPKFGALAPSGQVSPVSTTAAASARSVGEPCSSRRTGPVRPVGQIRGLVHIAHGHCDIRRWHPVQQLIDHETTGLSSRG
jgi:hypothetical protein